MKWEYFKERPRLTSSHCQLRLYLSKRIKIGSGPDNCFTTIILAEFTLSLLFLPCKLTQVKYSLMKVMLRLLPLQKNSVLFIRHPKVVPWSALIQTTLIKFVQLCVVLAPTSTLTRLCSTIVRLEVGVTFRCSLMFQLYPGQTVLVSALNNLECFGYIFKVH